jgi:hypothetical protein
MESTRDGVDRLVVITMCLILESFAHVVSWSGAHVVSWSSAHVVSWNGAVGKIECLSSLRSRL